MLSQDAVKDIAYGGIAGSLAKIIEFPFDTVKVRLQSNPSYTKKGTWEVIQLTRRNEGFINGFYKGLKAPMIGACLESAVLFVSYNSSVSYISSLLNQSLITRNGKVENPPLWVCTTSGGIAGIMAAFVLSPVELIKCKLQVANLSSNLSFTYSSIIQRILKTEGVVGLWRGLSSTIMRECGGTAVWFTTYEVSSDYLAQVNPAYSKLNLLVSGALSGFFFNFLMFPIDTIKSNIQTYDMLHKSDPTIKPPTFLQTCNSLIKAGGVKSLYHGLGITLVRAIPANALIFYTYEGLKENF